MQFSFVLFSPLLPRLFFSICASSDKYCFVFFVLFLFLFVFKWNWSTARAFDSDWRWNERTAPIVCTSPIPLFVAVWSFCLPCAIYFHLCVCRYTKFQLYILGLGTDFKLSHYFPIPLPIRLMLKWSMNIVSHFPIFSFPILQFWFSIAFLH